MRGEGKPARSRPGTAALLIAAPILLALTTSGALADNPYTVGSTIINPVSGAPETVTDLLGDDMVLTDQGHAILVLNTAVGDVFSDPNNPEGMLEVTAVQVNATTGLPVSVTVTDNASPPNVREISLVQSIDPSAPPVDPGNPGGGVALPIPAGNTNVVADARVGSRGAAGQDGFGVRFCLIRCVTIGRDATAGHGGGTGPTIDRTISETNIESVSDRVAGVTVSSRGGNGGSGGDALVSLGVSAAQGGAAGAGGDVTVNVTSDVTISTSGAYAYGVFAQSRAGNAGAGGDGYILSGGGGGGPPGVGGDVVASNAGTITTRGEGAVGLFAQSLGGGGGEGGDSFGIVGVGGAASQGGDGGSATAVNDGVITTLGAGAHGVFAQSIGGDGGDAGAAGGIVGLGSAGDSGGSGGIASATNNGRIETLGDGGIGVFAESVGGGGGNGGAAGGLVSIGGAGSGGGDGDAARVTNTGVVVTHGSNAAAMMVQSIGGGGGNGATSGGALFTLGGSGASGGAAGTATATNTGSLWTTGNDALGVLAQSIGGGGGNGGGAGSLSAFAGVAIGGTGGIGGDGSTVTVTSTDGSSIHTQGDRSTGLLAQSVGGGGGNGGLAAQATVGYQAGASLAIGGSGGRGGAGGSVDVHGEVAIATEGSDADGLLAQSVGGGGGRGGFAVSFAGAAGDAAGLALAIGVGGEGGGGGNGGDVTLDAGGIIRSAGDRSNGLLAQSIGGGGGSGGFAVTLAAGAAGGVAGSVAVGVGGSGGSGGDAGRVEVNYAGDILTAGATSRAVDVQAVGGGGGNGAFNVSGAVQASAGGAGAVTVGIGGSGGGGGDGGLAVANITGNLATQGDQSGALYVQSVGGGGGNGAFNVTGSITATSGAGAAGLIGIGGAGGSGGDGKAVALTLAGNVFTSGDASAGITAQSLGGGGGNGAFNVTGSIAATSAGGVTIGVGVGGAGGAGGDADRVVAQVTANTSTLGADSNAMLFQSLGGGGGNGAFNVTGALNITSGGGGQVGVGVGGFGGEGGDGGIVDASVTGDTYTRGDRSNAVVMQSLGGGGGNGAMNITAGASLSSSGFGATLGVGVGGFGGGGGNGSAVTGHVTGAVETQGDDSIGVLAQSLGGGGGNGALNVSAALQLSTSGGASAAVGVGGFAGDGGHAGGVSLVREGVTSTDGANSHGVVVQSLGGAGGNGGVNVAGALSFATGASGASIAGTVGIGGFGGGGGDGQDVSAIVNGDVHASGYGADVLILDEGVARVARIDGSHGVLAQSIGGGGGNGGLNVSAGVLVSPPVSGGAGSLNIGVGGWAGGGGDAGNVDLLVDAGIVESIGDSRFGVSAQSIGGAGGNGAINVTAGLVVGGQLNVGVGGFGGDGGLGRNVTAAANTDIIASGAGAIGFLTQSIGGGGGTGGINITGRIAAASAGVTPSLSFGLGGFGGAGNAAGDVSATQNGSIWVSGRESIGVLAQSIGGGGGVGGLDVSGNLGLGAGLTAAIGIGGTGGLGADAGSVTLYSDGQIVVDASEPATDSDSAPLTAEQLERASLRERANGILAQSIGGGGGTGGINLTGVGTPSGSTVAVGVGGSGGAGGDANAVSVYRGTHSQSIVKTTGNNANGLSAQSIGGGGGHAGIDLVLNVAGAANPNGVDVVIGGAGGAAGEGSSVIIEHEGIIATTGDHSDAILAQSIGGGGGDAAISIGLGVNPEMRGFNVALGGAPGDAGSGGQVTVDHVGTLLTEGFDSSAIVAQSIGGGGGDAAMTIATTVKSPGAVNISVGRVGGTGGTGGDVQVSSIGSVETLGDSARGIFAQSIGNGGGKSGLVSFAVTDFSVGGASTNVNVAIGLEGGAGGAAGAVDVTAAGAIITHGNDAHAIQAQSIGGGGGAGGGASNVVLLDASAIRIGVGGAGGEGGIAGAVTVDNAGLLATEGDGASGIYAQSIGGGGGVGGYAAALKFLPSASAGRFTGIMSVGGEGGSGASGGTVDVTNSGSIFTRGVKALGIDAESVGGGGGDGGMILNGSLTSGSQANSLGISLGGAGNSGGIGAGITVINEGTISTSGDQSTAIRARSIGGGGGDGGIVASLNLVSSPSASSSSALTGSVVIGGSGGTGNTGGEVTVVNRPGAGTQGGSILTQGESADGIYAESIGGGGGSGSSIVSAQLSVAAGASLNFGVAVGGDGGTGGTGGAVTVTNEGVIETFGNQSNAIVARSIGGGGGSGGMVLETNAIFSAGALAIPHVAVGGSGGEGNGGGTVVVNNSGSIITHGEHADGIVAQSIGGGGGNAGFGISLSSSATSTFVAGIASAVLGGRGGEGGEGGTVTVNHSGDILTLGANSYAVTAESINGGGGRIALDFDGITSLPGGDGLFGSSNSADTHTGVSFQNGGSGVHSSNAGRVTLNYTGTFGTAGDDAAGSNVRAIGGGGGDFQAKLRILDATTAVEDLIQLQGTLGGSDGVSNDGGEIDSAHVGDLATTGHNTPGLLMQSIGGGGGRASFNLTSQRGSLGDSIFRIGGTNGSQERGGDIAHTQTGSIATTGTASHGALVQSIGGGGGLLSYRLSASEITPAEADDASAAHMQVAAARSLDGALVSSQLGSAAGSELGGGPIQMALSGDVSTEGQNAVGLIFQSIGAGGGVGNLIGGEALDVTLGGANGAMGDGGRIDVSHVGVVSTTGERAHGVVLQSIGGGGGAVFTDVSTPSVSISSDNVGNGGIITYHQVGDIVAAGKHSYGLLAQSIGGGGGFVDGAFAGTAGGAGAGGAISLLLEGNVLSTGEQSTALLAQSLGGSGGNDIEVELASDHHLVGGRDGIAARFEGGANNVFRNNGTVMTLDGVAGSAFIGGSGNDRFINNGVVMGNVVLGGGSNRFVNQAGASAYPGATFDLGSSANMLINHGTLAPGGMQRAVVTHLNGSFQQFAGARSVLELDFVSGTLDSLFATGTAQLAGTVDVSLINPHAMRPGRYENVMYFADDGLTQMSLSLSVRPSAVIQYRLLYPNTQTVALGYDIDFAPAGLVGNRIAVGDYINRVQEAGSSVAMSEMIQGLVLAENLVSYSNALTQLGAEMYVESQASVLSNAQSFTRAMENCGGTSYGAALKPEGLCAWARVESHPSSRDSVDGFPQVDVEGQQYTFGVQYAQVDGWALGAGLAVGKDESIGFQGAWRGEATLVGFSWMANRSYEQSSISAVVTIGNSEQHVRRRIDVGQHDSATGTRNVSFLGGVLNFRHDFALGVDGLTLTPTVDLGGMFLSSAAMTESGAGGANVTLDRAHQGYAWAEPALSLGLQRDLPGDTQLRAHAQFGMLQYLSTAQTSVAAGLAGAPADVTPMQITSGLDSTHWRATAGIEWVATDRFRVGVDYTEERSSHRSGRSAGARFVFGLR